MVTDLCFGTMTFGAQNTETEAFALLDRAYDAGIDFYDTAEVYPVPPKLEYVNRTEEIVGRWLKTKPRDGIILATKIAGPAHGWFNPPIRSGKNSMDRHHIRRAIEGSLRRLQTDYVDLYQTHWPDHDFGYEETLSALDELKREGLDSNPPLRGRARQHLPPRKNLLPALLSAWRWRLLRQIQ